MRRWQACLAGGLVATGCYPLMPAGGPWRAIWFGLAAAACVVAMVLAIRRYGPQQPSTWYCLVAGMTAWIASSVLQRLSLGPPGPGIVDALNIAGYVLLGAAVLGFIRGRVREQGVTGLLDAGIVGTSIGLPYWIFLVSGSDWQARVNAVGDVTLFALGSLLFTTPGARTVSYRLLLCAVLLTAVSDVTTGMTSEISSLFGNVLVAAAAMHPSMRRLTVPLRHPPPYVRPRMALLGAAILLSPSVSLYLGATGRIDRHWLPTGIAGIALFLLVTVRMSGLIARVESQARTLTELAHRDALTGLPNRRAWDERLATGTDETVFVGLLDLDHFKAYNDTYGHPAGDVLLADAAAAWRGHLREGDLLARYGGEEFGVLLTADDDAEAVRVVERMLAATPSGQTFSAGLVRWDGRESVHGLLKRADDLLYESKRAGRARVTTSVAADLYR